MQIRIDPPGPQHIPVIQRFASDPAIGATSNVPFPYPVDGARVWIQRMAELRESRAAYAFVLSAGAEVVGVSSIVTVDWAARVAAIGYWIGRPYWSRGFATSGTRLVLEFAFGELHLSGAHATCLVQNKASARVLEKLGFSATGPGPEDPRGQTLDYRLARADFPGLPPPPR